MDADSTLTLAEAAKVADRSTSTLRRWIQSGELVATTGNAPRAGGRAPFVIRAGDLFQALSDMGVKPKQSQSVHKPPQGTAAPATATATPPAGEVAELRFAVERSKLEHQAETARLRLAHGLERMNDLERQISMLRSQVARLESEAADWRERHDAREAEVRALRASLDLPWYRRLLGGPVAQLETAEG